MTDGAFWLFTGVLGFERLIEILWARRNEKRLRTNGFEEQSAGHFPAIILLHILYFASLIVEFSSNGTRPLLPAFIAFFVLVQLLRFWIMIAMGGRFTTRIFVKEGEKLLHGGPYRFLKHPLYVVVELEIVSLALVTGAYYTALLFGIANAALLLFIRIPAEDRALSKSRSVS